MFLNFKRLTVAKERIDDLQWNGLKIIQDEDLFCFGCDAVELANFVHGSRGSKVCDLGAGNGIISILLAAKKGFFMTAVEILEESARLCERNAALNGLSGQIDVLNLPMQELVHKFEKGSFDMVVTNPPYAALDSGASAEGVHGIARHEVKVTAAEVLECAAHLLKFGGKFFCVYPSNRLSEIMRLCSENLLEPKVLQLLTPNANKPPHLFLLEAIKNGKTGLKILRERQVDTSV